MALFITIDRRLGPGQWADLGGYIHALAFLARGYGLDTCPQEAWARLYDTVGDFLKLPENEMLFCGMAIGYGDRKHKANDFRSPRAELHEFCKFYGFDQPRLERSFRNAVVSPSRMENDHEAPRARPLRSWLFPPAWPWPKAAVAAGQRRPSGSSGGAARSIDRHHRRQRGLATRREQPSGAGSSATPGSEVNGPNNTGGPVPGLSTTQPSDNLTVGRAPGVNPGQSAGRLAARQSVGPLADAAPEIRRT